MVWWEIILGQREIFGQKALATAKNARITTKLAGTASKERVGPLLISSLHVNFSRDYSDSFVVDNACQIRYS